MRAESVLRAFLLWLKDECIRGQYRLEVDSANTQAQRKRFGLASYWWAVIGVVLGAFVVILNNSLINVGIPTLMQIFHASEAQMTWVVTGYMITLGVIIPISGFVVDRWGTKRIYLIALLIFAAGAAGCTVATSVPLLILFRIIQALGGALIMPSSMTIIYRAVPFQLRGTALGLWGIAAMVAPAIGPTLSGYLLEYTSWHWLFLINVPVALLALGVGAWVLSETPTQKEEHFDFAGFIASTIGMVTLLLAFNEAKQLGWTSGLIIGFFIVAILSFVFFVRHELRVDEPLLQLRVFASRTFSWAMIVVAVTVVGLFCGVFLIPLYTQGALGFTPIETGLLLLPAAAATAVLNPIAGRLFDQYGPRWVVGSGVLIVAGATLGMAFWKPSTSFSTMLLWLLVRGIGLGMSNMTATSAALNTVRPEWIARASAINNVVRQVSGALGIALLTSLYSGRIDQLSARGFSQIEAASLSFNRSFLIVALLSFCTVPLAFLLRRTLPAGLLESSSNQSNDPSNA